MTLSALHTKIASGIACGMSDDDLAVGVHKPPAMQRRKPMLLQVAIWMAIQNIFNSPAVNRAQFEMDLQ